MIADLLNFIKSIHSGDCGARIEALLNKISSLEREREKFREDLKEEKEASFLASVDHLLNKINNLEEEVIRQKEAIGLFKNSADNFNKQIDLLIKKKKKDLVEEPNQPIKIIMPPV